MNRLFQILTLSVLLINCGNQDRKNTSQVLFGMLFEASRAAAAENIDPRTLITREAIDALEGTILLLGVENRDAFGTFVLLDRNPNATTWVGADGTTITTHKGFVIGTRGLGNDLMFGNTAETFRRTETYATAVRRLEHLDAENRIVVTTFDCSRQREQRDVIQIYGRSLNVTWVQEYCKGESGQFTNEYWFSASGSMVQSRQWVGSANAFLSIQRLGE